MPTERELPDVETLLITYLEGDGPLDGVVHGRISTKLPKSFKAEGRVRLFLAGGSEVDPETGHVSRAVVSTHNFGATDTEAFDVARKTLVALRKTVTADFAGMVVTRAARSLGPVWSPDPETNAPRYIVDVILTLHPTAL